MDTKERRLNLARHLRQLAETIGKADRAYDFDLALDELHQVGNDANGYHQRTLTAMYEEQGED
jgi:hypothetical protein